MYLNKCIAHSGICSRRRAGDFIAAGRVSVNGSVITFPYYVVQDHDTILVDGKKVRIEHNVYILLNKPKNCITTVSDEKSRRTVIDLIDSSINKRIYPVGRLDRDTTGVLLLTNDGELAQQLAHPKYQVQKIYAAVLNKPLENKDLIKIRQGVYLSDGPVKVDSIESISGAISHSHIRIKIHSGRYRVIRRLFEHLGYRVLDLERIAFAGLSLTNLPRGHYRMLQAAEVKKLKRPAHFTT